MNIEIPGIRVAKIRDDRVVIYCPIHKGGQEKRPAASIFFRSGRWRCHACGQGGPIKELMQYMGMGKDEADRIAAGLKSLAPSYPIQNSTRPICPEYYLGAFNRRPLNLIKAGYTRKILDQMEVGFDDVRCRVIYPIRSPKGELYGVVGGAVFPESDSNYSVYYGTEPKYLAYGPIQGFPFQVNPKWSLWNYNSVAANPDKETPVAVVEGFKATMWILMTGYEKVIATCGASYELSQVELIARLGSPVLLFLDNDDAGRSAAKRLQSDLRKRIPGVAIVQYPRDVQQPDDLTFEEILKCLRQSGKKGRKDEQ